MNSLCGGRDLLVTVTKAYADGSGADGDGDGISADPELGSVVGEMRYDGLGRRIVKDVKNMADLDCKYYFYHDGQSIVEIRNGSDMALKQLVWGRQYIDELVQVGINQDLLPRQHGELVRAVLLGLL